MNEALTHICDLEPGHEGHHEGSELPIVELDEAGTGFLVVDE